MFTKLIEDLSKEESVILKNYLTAEKVQAGSIIMEMGDSQKDIYFMVSGEYSVYQRILVAQAPTVLHVASLKGANLLGEMNLFLDETRQASVIATSDCKYFKVSQEQLDSLLENEPKIAARIYKQAGKTLTERFTSTQESIYTKVIETSLNNQTALSHMNRFIGPTKQCSISLAKKLFPHCRKFKPNF